MRLRERVNALEVIINALVGVLIDKDVISHDDVQMKIVENATKGESDARD